MTSDLSYFNEKRTILEQLISDGAKNLVPTIELLLNEAMKLEREAALMQPPMSEMQSVKDMLTGIKKENMQADSGN